MQPFAQPPARTGNGAARRSRAGKRSRAVSFSSASTRGRERVAERLRFPLDARFPKLGKLIGKQDDGRARGHPHDVERLPGLRIGSSSGLRSSSASLMIKS